MRKFLSYILTFISIFVISAVVTIRVKSDLINSTPPTTSVGASGQTTLLAGIMDSIEDQPKMDIDGSVSVKVEDTAIEAQLNASIDLTTLTNPSVKASVGLNINNQQYQILLTYTQNEIYLACGDIAIQARVEDISQLAGLFATVLGDGISLPNISLPQIDLDAVMAALSNSNKTQVDDITYYQITLPDIAKVTLVCDEDYHIQGISVDEVYILENANVVCDFNVNQDNNIEVTAPTNNGYYLDVATVVQNFISLKDKNLISVNGYTSIYKDKRLFERIDSMAFLGFADNNYYIKNDIKGALNGKVNVGYINNDIYATFNDIAIKATSADINSLTQLMQSNASGSAQIVEQSASLTQELLNWLKNNYNNLLDNAVVSSNQIVLVADLNGLLGQTNQIKFVLGLKDNQISSIKISGLTFDNIAINASLYVSAITEYNFAVDESKYYSVGQILEVVDWVKGLKTLNIESNLTLQTADNQLPLNFVVNADLVNNAQQLETTILGMPINVTINNGVAYVNIANNFVSINNTTIGALLSQIIDPKQSSQIIDKITNVVSSLTLNEVLSLVNISTTSQSVNIKSDLSHLLAKPCIIDISLEYQNGITLNINKLQFDTFVLSGDIKATNSEDAVIVNQPDKYLNIEDFVEYAEGFVTSQTYTIDGTVDLSTPDFNQQFVGSIGLDFGSTSVKVAGKLQGKLNADIELIYTNNTAYIIYNKQKFSISKQELIALANEFGLDLTNIFATIDQVVEFKNNLSVKGLIAAALFGGMPEVEALPDIQVAEIANIINNVQISSGQINSQYAFDTFNILANVGLQDNLQLNVEFESETLNLGANLTISKTCNIAVEDNHINLDLLVPHVIAAKNTAECNNFSGTLNLSLGENPLQNFAVEYKIFVDIANMQFAAELSTTYQGIFIKVVLIDEQIYLQVEDIYLNVTMQQLSGFVATLFEEEIANAQQAVEKLQNVSTEEILQTVYDVTTSQALISKLYNLDGRTYITLFNNMAIALASEQAITYVGFTYDTITAQLTINATQDNNLVTLDNREQYLNIVDFVEYAESFVTSQTYTIDGTVDLSTPDFNQQFVGRIGLDFGSTSVKVAGKLQGKLNADIELVYTNNTAYITYNKQKFSISKQELIALANEFGLDLTNIFATIEQVVEFKNNLSLLTLLGGLLTNGSQSVENVAIDISFVADLLKAFSLNSTNIAIDYATADTSINANLSLNSNLGVEANITMPSLQANANLTISKTATSFEVENDYINLGLLVGYPTAIKNTLNNNAFAGELQLNLGSEQLTINYDIRIIDNAIEVALYTTYLDMPISVHLLKDRIYLNINQIYVNVTTQQLFGVISQLFGDEINDITNYVNNMKNITLEEILQTVYTVTTQQTLISSLTKTDNMLNIALFNNILLKVAANQSISLVEFAYNNIAASLTLEATQTTQSIQVANAEDYINVEDLLNYFEGFVTSQTYTIDGTVDLSTPDFNQQFVGSIGLDFGSTSVKVAGKLQGKLNADIELVYTNNTAYITYNKQKFSISKQELIALANEFGLDLTNIFATIDQVVEFKNNLSLLTLLGGLLTNGSQSVENVAIDISFVADLLKAISLNSTNIAVDYAIADTSINANLSLNSNLGVEANLTMPSLQANANLTISKTATSFEVEEGFINLDNAAGTIDGLINTIQDNKFVGTIDFAWGTEDTQTIFATYDISIIDNKIYAHLTLKYLEQTATIMLYDSQVYLNIKGVYIKATIEQITEILNAEIPEETKQDIDQFITDLKEETSKDIFVTLEEITSQSIIDSLQFVDNTAVIDIMGAKISIRILNNKLNKVEVVYNGYSAIITIASSTTASVPTIDASNYVDINTVYNLVKNVYNYIKQAEYNVNVNISVLGYTITGYIGYNEVLQAQLYTTVLNKQLTLVVDNDIIYVTYDGFNAKLSMQDIPTLVTEINNNFNLEVSADILNIIDALFNKNSTADLQQSINNLTGDINIDIKDLLKTLNISLTDTNLLVTYNDINADIKYSNNMIDNISVQYLSDSQTQDTLTATINRCDKQQIIVPSNYLDIATVTPLLKDIAAIVNTTNYAGEFTLTAGEFEIIGQYKIAINSGVLSAQIETSYYDLPVKITIVDNSVYVLIDNIKIYGSLTEINDIIAWINSSFDTNIDSNLNISTNLSSMTGDMSLDNLRIGDIVADIIDNVVNIKYQDISAKLSIGSTTTATLEYKQALTISLDLATVDNTITVNADEYLHYSKLTNLIDSVVDLYKGKKIAATAMGYVYEGDNLHYTATCNVQIDLENLQLYANVSVLDNFKDSTTTFMLAFKDNYWFVDYNNLKLKIVKTDLAEIMAILLDLVGIDPSLLPFLEGVAGGLNVDVESMQSIVPKLDFGNPLVLIDVFEQLKLAEDSLSVIIDNALISDKINTENMTAEFKTTNGKVNYIAINNLYTGITDYEHLNLTLTMAEFNGVSNPTEGRYIDISGSNELIKALINTAELNYFEVQGTINLNLGIKAISLNLDWDIPLNIKVRLDENRKPEVLISLGSIPAVVGVNNDVPYEFGDLESSDSRMWYIYYKDNYIYMLREDQVDWYRIVTAGSRTYQKKLKAHVDSVFDDFFYYLQWGLGFTDAIMGEIEKALALTDNYSPDLGTIINSFTSTDKQNFAVDINLQELSNNPMVKNMVVNLGVVNNQSTNNKNYLGKAGLYLYMPIEKDVFEIDIESKDLTLVNIGKSFDFTAFESFVYNYVGKEGVEYDRTWDNGKAQTDWSVAAERVYTIQFEEMGGQAVSDISGKPGDKITLPTLGNKVVLDSAAGKRYIYSFGGWYTTEPCKNGTEFSSTTMPRSNKVLYAKWVLIATENVIVISFNSNGGTAIESISGFAGTWVDVNSKKPTKATTWVDNGYNWVGKNAGKWTYVYTHYSFAGWYTDSACTKKFDGYMPNSNITLYAKWNITTETKYHYNWDRP